MLKHAGAICGLCLSFFAGAAEARTSNFTIDAYSAKRSAILHIPEDIYETEATAPILFLFHGPGESAGLIEKTTGVLEEADKRGYIVVLPDGTQREPYSGLYWNVAPFLAEGDDYGLMTDEAFIEEILKYLEENRRVDRARIFVGGYSMGGMFAYKLVCSMPDVFSAAAVISGAQTTTACDGAMPVSILDIHGLSDERVPYAGGQVGSATWPETAQTIRNWQQKLSCGPDETYELGDDAMCLRSSCIDGNVIQHCVGYEMAHEWPGKKITKLQERLYGPAKPTKFDATELMFDFFDSVPGRVLLDVSVSPAGAEEVKVESLGKFEEN